MVANAEDDFLKRFRELHTQLTNLAYDVLPQYSDDVEGIINTRCRETERIEHTLDNLLNICFHSEALLLYRRLCQYYYTIDKQAAIEYVKIHRDTWEEDSETNK